MAVGIEESQSGSAVVLLNGDKAKINPNVDEIAEQAATIIEP
jgi:hypothetical protein